MVEGYVQDIKNLSCTFITLRLPYQPNKKIVKQQYVVKNPILLERIKTLKREQYIEVDGVLESTQGCKEKSSYECTHIRIMGRSNPFWGESLYSPILKTTGLPYDVYTYRRDHCKRIMDFRHNLNKSIREYMDKHQALQLTTPKLIKGSPEGGSELFNVSYYGEFATLSQSPQLYKQAAVNMGYDKVYLIGPVYRAQKFKTVRHLLQASCLDYEAKAESLQEVMNFLKDLMIYCLDKIGIKPVFKVISYDEAITMLDVKDLDTANEKRLVEVLKADYVFVTRYPKNQKPFYVKEKESFDLLCSFGELSSGSLRERDAQKLNMGGIDWYLSMFKGNNPPTGGFGFGLDRWIAYILNLPNVKESNPLLAMGTLE